MAHEFSTFIGVDCSTSRKPFTYVALDLKRKQLAVGSGGAVDVLSFAAGQSSALLALSAPPHRGSFKAARGDEPPLPALRLNRLHQLSLDGEPTVQYPSWLQPCFNLVQQLQALDFSPFSAEASPRQWLEAPAESGFHALLGLDPFDAGTLEGRIQRQLALFDLELDVPDAMEFFEEITRFKILRGHLPYDRILPPGELNAWLAASTGWAAACQPESARMAGGDENGIVYYPLKAQEETIRS